MVATVTELRHELDDVDLINDIERTVGVLQGKWKVHLLFCLARGIRRHNRLREALPSTPKKVMIAALRALERDGLITREVYAEVPVRVEYALTPLGWSLSEPLIALADWSREHTGKVEAARAAFDAPADRSPQSSPPDSNREAWETHSVRRIYGGRRTP